MSTKHYLLSAKTCDKLTEKYLVLTEAEFDDLPNKEQYVVDSGPKDILDALFDKAEKIENIILDHVRWSVMRNGHDPAGTFNGNFVDGEFYKIVERGSFSSYWRYRRSMLVEAAIDTIANFKAAEAINELDSMCNVLYTDLNRSVYENDGKPLTAPVTNLSAVDENENKSQTQQNDFAKIWEETVARENTTKKLETEQLSTDQKQLEEYHESETQNITEEVATSIIPGIRLIKLEYAVNSSQDIRNTIGLQLHNEIYNWVKVNKEIKNLLLTKNYVEVYKSKIKIKMYPRNGVNPIPITYTPSLNGDSYIVDIQGMIVAIKNQVMMVLGDKIKVSLDTVGSSYDPRPEAIEIDHNHKSIPYDAKPERDMRGNMLLEEKELLHIEAPKITTPIASVAEDDIGVLLDRIKDNTDNVLAITIDNDYILVTDLKKAIGEFNTDSETSHWLCKHAVAIAKSIKMVTECTIDNISFETIEYIVQRLKGIRGFQKFSINNIDYDKISLIVDDLLNKEFIGKDYFKSCIKDADDRTFCHIALKIAGLIASNYHAVDIVKEIDNLKSVGLTDRLSHVYMLSLLGVPCALLDTVISTECSRARALATVFNPESDYEFDFCNIKRNIPYMEIMIKIAKHYFNEKGNISLYDLLMNHYKEYLSDGLVQALALRAINTCNMRGRKK